MPKKCQQWYSTPDGSAYTTDGRYVIDNLDNGYYLLCCRASGLRKLCPTMSDAMRRARLSAAGVPYQLT
jgi:hypothetical protein